MILFFSILRVRPVLLTKCLCSIDDWLIQLSITKRFLLYHIFVCMIPFSQFQLPEILYFIFVIKHFLFLCYETYLNNKMCSAYLLLCDTIPEIAFHSQHKNGNVCVLNKRVFQCQCFWLLKLRAKLKLLIYKISFSNMWWVTVKVFFF